MHLAKTSAKEEESQMIVVMDYNNLYLMSVTVNENPSRERLGKLTCLDDSEQDVKIFRGYYYSEGLLLCIMKNDIVVWNPYSGQTKWIKPKYPHQKWPMYALGYVNKEKNKSRRSHKILSSLWFDIYIYDFDSDSWTALDITSHWRLSDYQPDGVSLKGNTYWCATKSVSINEDVDEMDDHIICFDFTSEKFGLLMRLPFSAGVEDYTALSCVGEEKLAVILMHNEVNPCEIDVWITTKIDPENVSWSKFLTLNMKPHLVISSKWSFIDEEKKLAIGFNDTTPTIMSIVGETGYLRQLDLREPGDKICNYVCSYASSLVQIKQSKREKRSNLEKPVKKQSAGGGKKRKKDFPQ